MVATQPTGGPAFEKFTTRPAPVYVSKFQEHVARTARPETFPGLHPGPISNNQPFIILANVSLDRHKRGDGSKAPCPMCQPNKFFEGKLAFFPNLQAVAAIGHCCALSSHRTEAERRFKKEQEAELALDALLTGIPLNRGRAEEIDSLLPIADEASRVFNCFRSEGAWYHKALRSAAKSGAQLTVAERITAPLVAGMRLGMRTSGSDAQYADVYFGVLQGKSAVATKFTVPDQLRQARQIFEVFDRQGDDAILELVTPMTDEERKAAAKAIEQAVTAVERARRTIADFRSFFSAENIGRIDQWGSHPDASFPMSAELRAGASGSRRTLHMKGQAPSFWVTIDEILWGQL